MVNNAFIVVLQVNTRPSKMNVGWLRHSKI